MGINMKAYHNNNGERENSVVVPYYNNSKPGRLPRLVEKIIYALHKQNITCYVYPQNINIESDYVKNLGTLTEKELNELYNKCKVGIIFSSTNPSRFALEMYTSGLNVIEYDSEFTKYDLPSEYFTKIKDDKNIVEIVNDLFHKIHDNSYVPEIDIETDNKRFIDYIEQGLK
jgi:hypothetical protein